MICWLNGVYENIEQVRIDPRDRGFLLGDGIFETMLAVDGAVHHAKQHLARLSGAAELLGIPMPFSNVEITDAMMNLLKVNHLTLGRAALRLTLTRGVGARGVAPPSEAAPTILMTVVSAPPPPVQMRGIISSYVRNEKSVSSRIKSLNYLDNILARNEAAQKGADEALMCNGSGDIVCASAANIFIAADGVLYTPPVGNGALAGIMRGIVMEAAMAQDIPYHEAPISRAALANASEAFLTNALIGVCPLIWIDGLPVGSGETGPITRRLRA